MAKCEFFTDDTIAVSYKGCSTHVRSQNECAVDLLRQLEHVPKGVHEVYKAGIKLSEAINNDLNKTREKLEAAMALLAEVKEQGLSHQCALEGHIDKYGCVDCTKNLEQKIETFLAGGAEKTEDHHGAG